MEISILIGGQAGEGTKQAGKIIAMLLNKIGYYSFIYDDHPSLIKGGHNFSIIRSSEKNILAHKNKIDILLALNQETIELHKERLNKNSIIIFDKNTTKAQGIGLPITELTKQKNLPQIAKNMAFIGALCAILKINFSLLENLIKQFIKKDIKESIELARESYEKTKENPSQFKIELRKDRNIRLITGNEAIGEGAVYAGLNYYLAYPMTPATGILHHLAENEEKFKIKTLQPENEISVIGMAQGISYAGKRAMIGTSGGGFALMVEHISLAGQAEIPTMIVLSQRPGPATGTPTYTEQADLLFSLNAGHGEFPRIVLAPGDAEEAFYLSGESLNLTWKFQIPVILLSDKQLSESTFSAKVDHKKIDITKPKLWDKKEKYKRYNFSKDGISQLAFPGEPNAVIKYNSYEHDEFGISVETSELVKIGHEKRLVKQESIEKYIEKLNTVNVYGKDNSKYVLITWGSTKGPALEVAENLKLKLVQPVYLGPFPTKKILEHTKGKKLICIEVNSTGQLNKLLNANGIKTDHLILKYNGRPFSVDELEEKVKELIK